MSRILYVLQNNNNLKSQTYLQFIKQIEKNTFPKYELLWCDLSRTTGHWLHQRLNKVRFPKTCLNEYSVGNYYSPPRFDVRANL